MNSNTEQSPEQYYMQPNRQGMNCPGLYPPRHPSPPDSMPNNPNIPPDLNFPVQPYRPGMQPPWPNNGFREGPPTTTDINYTAAFLKTQIGSPVKVDFLIGTNMFMDRTGVLVEVGANYIILRETDTNTLLLCDLYAVKFVRFFR